MNVISVFLRKKYYGNSSHTFAKHLITSQIQNSFFNNFSSKSTILYIMTACIKLASNKIFTLAGLLILFSSQAFAREFPLFGVSPKPLPPEAANNVERSVRLTFDKSLAQTIFHEEPNEITIRFPMPGGEFRQLTFFKKAVTTSDFKVSTSEGRTFTGKDYTGVQYQINPESGPEKIGGLGFSKNGSLFGLFSNDEGNWNIGPLPGGNGDYVIFCEKDLKVQSRFHCETPEEDHQGGSNGPKPGLDKSIQTSGTCKEVKVYFECDFKMYQDNGSSVSNTTTRVTNIFNLVKQLYKNDQLDVDLSQVFVWTSTDPYATVTSSSTYLFNFASNRASITQNLGHLITTRPTSLGGLAYVNVLCSPTAKFAFSNIFNSFSALPTYSWTISCIAHEMGHNFGSKHTHWCGWQLTPTTIGRIDSCYAGESVTGAVNCSNSTRSNLNGTIMSYCHLNGAINFNRGFGPIPGNTMRTNFANATCITGSPVPNFTASGSRIICEGSNLNLNISTSMTGGTFAWTGPNGFSSTSQNPVINSATSAASGAYSATMTRSGCTSDPVTVNVVVNGISNPPIVDDFQGSFPAAAWRIANPNNDRTFVKSTTVGAFGSSGGSVSFDNYNLPMINGRRDTLFLPVVNLVGLTGANFKFDVAHATNGMSFDSLTVVASTNCGRTFSRIWRKGGATLATAASTINPFTPTSSQWRTENISLAAYEGQGQVQLAFVNRSENSNFIFIDNVNLSTTGGTGSPSISLIALAQSSYCPGATLNIGFSATGTFNSGNSFSVQLSNSSGSFSSPTTIGSGSGSPISVSIPSGTSAGTGYSIRVVSSNPNISSPASSAFSIAPLVVSAGSAQSVCAGSANLNLTGTPAGGTWSGNGVSTSGIFTPTSALVGNQTLTYSVSSGGCSGSNTVTITVRALPSVNAGNNISTCSGSTPFTLSGNSPTGGTWSGPGVNSSGLFTPTTGLIGTQTLTYTVTSNGCTNSDTRNVTVSATIAVDAGSNQTLCSNSPSITLNGSPAGGTWSGTGVNASGVFTPSSAGSGNKVLTYTVSGSCGGTDQLTITVNTAPTVNAGIDQTYCKSDGPQAISQGTPIGGTWSGPGVSGSTFDPTSLSPGSYTLTYSFSQNGCNDSQTADFTVNANPVPVVSGNQNLCTGSGNITLTASPAGGNWSGNGVSTSGIFTPSTSNIGANTLTYNVVQNGCSGSANSIITVSAIPVVDAGADQSTLSNAADITISGNPSGGIWSGTGVSSAGVFSPSSAGPGTFTLTYSVTSGGCTGTDQMVFTVLPAAIVSAGSDQTICETASPLVLVGSPSGGTWSGNGVSPQGIFTPSSALAGNQTLTYTVLGFGSDEVIIQVVSAPVVNAGNSQSVCSNAANFSLTGASPAGGTWSGAGISSSGLVTVSQLSTSGSTFTYTVSQSGCTGSSQVVLTAVNPPVVNAGIDQSICKNAAPVSLVGIPAGGAWSGPGVNASGLFDPASTSAGTKTLTYSVEGSIPGCAGTDQVSLTVFSVPTVSAGIDRTTCSNASPFTLSGTPAGGSWSGLGVNLAGVFSPNGSLVGIQTLTYTVTQNGCSNFSTTNVTVNAVPNVSAGTNQSICTNTPSFTLSGASPSGGTWSGPAFVNASGLCTGPFSTGNFTLTYTSSQNGCTGSAQISVQVAAAPTVNAGNNRNICSNANSLTLTGFSPSGGVWSGNGVSSSGVFSPSSGLVGNQILTYTVSQNGCAGSDQMTMNVKAIPAIVTGPNETACESGIRFKLNGYSPRGGIWSGPGVVNDSLFQPSGSLVGSQTLTYTVTRNGCTNSAQKSVQVAPGTVFTQGTFPANVCANNSPVSFSGFLPGGGTWKGPGMAANGLLSPAANLVGSQTYTYRLDQNGCRDSISVLTAINAVPVVNAGIDITVCATGASVALTNAIPTGGIWSGQGVNDSGIFTPTSVAAGNYPLTYSVEQNGCTGSDVLNVLVTASPFVNAGNDRNVCKNSIPVTLVGSPFGGTWSGNGISSTGVFTPNSNMSGNITLTYSINENGCTGNDQVIVSITNALAINAGNAIFVCDNGLPFNLTGFSPSGGSWSGTNVSPTGNFSPAGLPAGNLVLNYRVVQPGCTVVANRTVTVKAAPLVVAGNDQSVCSNDAALTLTGFSPGGGTWSGAGVNSTGIFTPGTSTPGPKILTYSVTQDGCTETDTRVITIIEAPEVNAGPEQTICGLQTDVAMTGFFPSGGSWTGLGINSQGVFNPTSNQLGSNVVVTYTVSQNGCTNQSSKTLNIVNIPAQVLVLANALNACEGQLLPLSLGLSNPELFAIQWKKDGNPVSGASAPTLLASTSGQYLAEVKSGSCQINSDEKTLVFNPIPGTPVITVNGNTLQSSSSSGNQWKLNGQNIPGANGQTYIPVQSGIYTVVVSNGGCESNASAPKPFNITEVSEIVANENVAIAIYPNPSDGRFTVSSQGWKSASISIRIYDALGKNVWQEEWNTTPELTIESEIEMPKLPAGIFWIQFLDGQQRYLRKIVLR
jgi:hypothetical protein